MYQHKTEKDIRCPLEYGMELFGGKWKTRIICVLGRRKMLRYGELKKELNNITDTVLAATLKELADDGIIKRTQYNEIPPRVEYQLSDKGESVIPILLGICSWSGSYCKEDIEANSICCKCDYRADAICNN